MDVEEQFEALVMMADELNRTGVIDSGDWREMVEEANAFYAHAIEGLEGGRVGSPRIDWAWLRDAGTRIRSPRPAFFVSSTFQRRGIPIFCDSVNALSGG